MISENGVVHSPLLIVSTNQRNLELLVLYLEKAGYSCRTAATLEEIDAELSLRQKPRLALVDITGFNAAIWERCERMRDALIPILVISPRQTSSLQLESISHGARGLLIKPLVINELIALVHNLVEDERESDSLNPGS